MATSMRTRKSKAPKCNNNTNTSSALVMSKNNCPPRHFVLSLTQPKIKIKIPHLILKTMNTRRNNNNNHSDDDGDVVKEKSKSNKWAKQSMVFAKKKIGAICSDVFGLKEKKKPTEKDCIFTSGADTNIAKSDEDEKSSEGLVKSSLLDQVNDEKKSEDEEEKEEGVLVNDNLFKSFSLKKVLEKNEDEEDEQSPLQITNEKKKRRKSLPFSIFRTEKSELRGQIVNSDDDDKESSCGGSNRVLNFRRRFSMGCGGVGMGKQSSKKLMKEENFVYGDDDNDKELCKKRILMGEKCKPLSVLQYGKDGLLLPEI